MVKSLRLNNALRGRSIFGFLRQSGAAGESQVDRDLVAWQRNVLLYAGAMISIVFVTTLAGVSLYRMNELTYSRVASTAQDMDMVRSLWDQQLWTVGGLVFSYAFLAIAFSIFTARTWQRSKKDYSDLYEAQRLSRLGHFSYDLKTDKWVSSEILDGIFGGNPNNPHDDMRWWLLTGRWDVGREGFMDLVAETPGSYEREYSIIRPSDNQERWVDCKALISRDARGEILSVVGTIQDITERKLTEREISKLAFFDTLTNLPNRRLAMERLESALAASRRSKLYGAVMFLDIDRFKTINDSFGHAYGDLILIEAARRLKSCVREVDTVARFGGDEFVIIAQSFDESIGVASLRASQLAEKVRAALQSPYEISGAEHHSSTSIGVTMFRGHESTSDTLIKQADMAMYQAKDSGRNLVAYFEPKMQDSVENRSIMEGELHRDILANRLELHYQIQVDEHHHAVGAEALLRWNHAKLGFVPPSEFIPLAEESSLIIDLGIWVLDSSCRQLAAWAKSDLTKHLSLAVNVSAKQFSQHDFVKIVSRLLRVYDFPPDRLKLELTESVMIAGFEDVVHKMNALKVLGIGLSMDDFGTGYSSLSNLKNLPVDQVKIDQSFVRDIASDANDAMMVKTIIDLAKNFHLAVIAEGVETVDQLRFLKENGCLAYQGYHFGKPMPIAQFEVLLKTKGHPLLKLA